MTMGGPVAQSAQFVPGVAGTRLRMVSQPVDGVLRGTVVWAHAFAEEMNKTRRMSGRMARLLATQGWRVVQKDLQGCGDSSGEFRDASWATWIDDLGVELAQADRGLPVWLWCVRAGTLLAPALIETRPDLNLLLWQPVVKGAQHLQQFLRLHAGARIVGSGKSDAKLSPAQMLRAGSTVEVGGYELAPAVAMGMELASLDVAARLTGRVIWLEVSAEAQPAPSPATEQIVQQLRARGIRVDFETVTGPPFWQTQEIEDCEALLQRTQALVAAIPTP